MPHGTPTRGGLIRKGPPCALRAGDPTGGGILGLPTWTVKRHSSRRGRPCLGALPRGTSPSRTSRVTAKVLLERHRCEWTLGPMAPARKPCDTALRGPIARQGCGSTAEQPIRGLSPRIAAVRGSVRSSGVPKSPTNATRRAERTAAPEWPAPVGAGHSLLRTFRPSARGQRSLMRLGPRSSSR